MKLTHCINPSDSVYFVSVVSRVQWGDDCTEGYCADDSAAGVLC